MLSEDVVKVPLESDDKDEAIRELIELLVRDGHISDRDAALAAVEEREAACSTGIGNGLGLPHGKHASIDELCVAAGTCPDGIEFDAIDGEPVYVLFLILSQADNPGPHVRTLAEVANLMKSPEMVPQLAEGESSRAFIDMLTDQSERIAERS